MAVVCTSNPSLDHTYSLTSDQLDDEADDSSAEDECKLSDIEDVDEDDLSTCDDDDFDEEDYEEFDKVDEIDEVANVDDKERVEKMVIELLVSKGSNEVSSVATSRRGGMTTRSMTSTTPRKPRRPYDDDEKLKRFDGVNALLNLSRLGSGSSAHSPRKYTKKTVKRADVIANNNNNNNNNNNCLKGQQELTLVKEEPMDEDF